MSGLEFKLASDHSKDWFSFETSRTSKGEMPPFMLFVLLLISFCRFRGICPCLGGMRSLKVVSLIAVVREPFEYQFDADFVDYSEHDHRCHLEQMAIFHVVSWCEVKRGENLVVLCVDHS